jgi:pilus assembly protein Flp/PilA
MITHLKRFLRDESGPTAVEYGVMLALIVVACIGSVNLMANATADSFDSSANAIASAFGS